MKNNTYKNNTYNRRKEEGVCIYCGKMPPQSGKLVCADCAKKRKLVDALRGRQKKAQSNKTIDTFKAIYEEVTKYNEEHGTNYSYGYYDALKFRGLI